MIYAGIGSRETPNYILQIFERMGTWLAKRGDVLRSGGANGADSAFEKGCDKVSGKKEIYLPWIGFNGRDAVELPGIGFVKDFYENGEMDKAHDIAKKYHPYWSNLSFGGMALIARDGFQVLGLNLDTPADFIVCYTKDGKMLGGTAQALRIAKDKNIPVFNAGNYQNEQDIVQAFNKFYFSIKQQKENPVIKNDVSDLGKTLLKYQADLAAKYRYKPLKEDMREIARNIYQDTLPAYFADEDNNTKPLHSPTGELIATGYDRIVIGDYGAFIEIDPKDMNVNEVYIPQSQMYRVNDPEYAEHVKYLWYEPKTGYPAKLYDQKKTVTYADYKADKWYVSPFETKEGYYEMDKTIDLPLIPPQREYYKTEDGYVNKITGEKKAKLNRGDVEIPAEEEIERD